MMVLVINLAVLMVSGEVPPINDLQVIITVQRYRFCYSVLERKMKL